MLGLVDQNNYFGFFFKYNGKSLKAFKQKDDIIQITFQKDHWLLRGKSTQLEGYCSVPGGRYWCLGLHCGRDPNKLPWAETHRNGYKDLQKNPFLSVSHKKPALDSQPKAERTQ